MKNTISTAHADTAANESAHRILHAAFNTWMQGEGLRQSRERNKNFTYGNQWLDTTVDDDGNRVTEYQRCRQQGCDPITNNMMRQLVKSVVGRFRSNIKTQEISDDRLQDAYLSNELDELDSRSLEEFLISGCCIQRLSADSCDGIPQVENVNLHRFFVNNLEDVRCRDCEIVGEIHDLSLAELILRVARGDHEKAMQIRSIYCDNIENQIAGYTARLGDNCERGSSFWYAHNGKCRAIEVWTLESREIARCHDRLTADYYELPYHNVAGIEKTNRQREKAHRPPIEIRWDISTVWHCRWFTPTGILLTEYDSPFADGKHPFVMKFYPLTDGEVHSFVEDIIDQQKCINRLVTQINRIMDSSAKGVLLFPEAGLPDGFTWEDIQRIWKRTNGIIPYAVNRNNTTPQQVSNNGTNIGAYEMLNLQMRLFEEISGVSGALQGKTADSTTGATLYAKQIENANIALTDVFDTFNSFRRERDLKILQAMQAHARQQ